MVTTYDPYVVDFIKDSNTASKTKEDVYKELLAQGFLVQTIQDGYSLLEKNIEKDDTSKRTVVIVVTFGAILISAGIFSFIAANWIYMSRVLKVAIILFFMLLSYILGWNLKEKLMLVKTGGAFILLGDIIFGAGLFLVGQIFNIQMFWSNGFLLWFLGTLLLAVTLESFSLFVLAVPIGIAVVLSSFFSMEFFYGTLNNNIISIVLLILAIVFSYQTGNKLRNSMPEEYKEFY